MPVVSLGACGACGVCGVSGPLVSLLTLVCLRTVTCRNDNAMLVHFKDLSMGTFIVDVRLIIGT